MKRALGFISIALGVASLVAPATVAGAATATYSDGTLDTVATASVIGTLSADGYVSDYLTLSDGRTAIVGTFTSYNGTPVHQMAVTSANGALDTVFNTNMGTGFLYTPFCNQCGSVAANIVRQQSDGKLLVAGYFQSFNGTPSSSLVRLNPNGTLDTAFAANLGTGFTGGVQTSIGTDIQDVIVQTDGKIVVVGDYEYLNGVQVNFISRLNADGSPDTAFNSNASSNCIITVSAAVLLPNGSLIGVGCDFAASRFNGIFSVGANGVRSTAFDTNVGAAFRTTRVDPSNQPYDVADSPWTAALMKDGGILLGGSFSKFNGATSPRGMLKIKSDGTLDTVFNSKLAAGIALLPTTVKPAYNDGFVADMKVQADGRIVLIGFFDTVAGKSHRNIARLNVDGSVDTTFTGSADFGTASYGLKLRLLTTGRILVLGTFTSWNGTAVTGHAVLGSAPVTKSAAAAATTPSTGSPARPAMFFVSMALIAAGGMMVRRNRAVA